MKSEFSLRAGRMLKYKRTRAGITRTEMAKCLGWSESYLRIVEDGSQVLGANAINHYAEALCIDPDVLVN